MTPKRHHSIKKRRKESRNSPNKTRKVKDEGNIKEGEFRGNKKKTIKKKDMTP